MIRDWRAELPWELRKSVGWSGDAGTAWAAALPDTVDRLLDRWALRPGAVFGGGWASLVLEVTRADGTPAVLKVPLPSSESDTESDALRLYDGQGAVRLHEHDPDSGALLLERVVPGTALSAHPDRDEAIDLACGLLRRLRRPPPAGHRFPLATALAREWAESIPRDHDRYGRPFGDLVDRGVAIADRFAGHTGPVVLVNRDVHLGNVLAATREPWLLIDPKPVVGEPAFDAGFLMSDLLDPDPRPVVAGRLVDRVRRGLGVPADRVRDWALLRAVENAVWSLTMGNDPSEFATQARALIAADRR